MKLLKIYNFFFQDDAFFNAATTLPRMRHRASSSDNSVEIVVESLFNTTQQRPNSKLFTVPIGDTLGQTIPPSITVEQRNLPKRTPSTKTPGFNTRRPQSIKKMCQWDDLKSIDMNG